MTSSEILFRNLDLQHPMSCYAFIPFEIGGKRTSPPRYHFGILTCNNPCLAMLHSLAFLLMTSHENVL